MRRQLTGNGEVLFHPSYFHRLSGRQNSVTSLADLDPAICVELCKIGPTRMHVVALVLAHLKVEPTPELGRLLLCGSIRQVIADTLGRDLPAGLGRAVARMLAKVLAQENYRRLIALLDHRPTAKLLFHSDTIDDALIDLLFQTPPAVRRQVLQLAQSRGECWSQYAGLSEGLHVLVTRGAADSFEQLVCTLASAKRPEQFLGKIRSVCDSLPLLPPTARGSTTRATARSTPKPSSPPIAGIPISASRGPACCSI